MLDMRRAYISRAFQERGTTCRVLRVRLSTVVSYYLSSMRVRTYIFASNRAISFTSSRNSSRSRADSRGPMFVSVFSRSLAAASKDASAARSP